MGTARTPAAADVVPDAVASPAGDGGAVAPPARRGRPRSEQADRAILQAASELLAERGLGGLSIEEVASRAGVGKATIYRRWSSRGTLALDAFLAEFQGQQPLHDTGTLRGDMLAALRAWIRSVTRTSAGRMLAGLIAEAQQDSELAVAWRERVVEQLRAQHKIMLDRAAARGEIPADTDPDIVLDLLFGAAYHRLLHGHQPLNDCFAEKVVDLIMTGICRPFPPGA
ncbi:MAG: TetR/AcrR family transcriptional regulator [Streptosporangiaceae bacterium]|jgi:AcrR family transcriptional regulator